MVYYQESQGEIVPYSVTMVQHRCLNVVPLLQLYPDIMQPFPLILLQIIFVTLMHYFPLIFLLFIYQNISNS